MASTGAVVYVRPRASVTVTASHRTGAVIYVPFRALSGVFTSVGVDPSRDLTNLRNFLPHNSVAVLQPGGTMNPAWYRFFQVFVDVFLGGAGAYTLDDIINTVTTSQANATQQAALTAAIATQSQTNAEALSAVKQVVTNNALTGADQIPEVQLSYSTQLP